MKTLFTKLGLLICSMLICVAISGCGKKEEAPAPAGQNNQTSKVEQAPAAPSTVAPSSAPSIAPEIKEAKDAKPKDVVVSVDGTVMKKDQLEKRMKEILKMAKGKIPEDKKKEVQEGLRKKIIEEFVIRTVLTNEANVKKIVATEKEIQDQIKKLKENIPADKNLDAFMKENNITREDLAFGIKIQKLVSMDLGKDKKVTDKEINKFYADNKDKFSQPETAHVRHVLVLIDPKDDEKIKAEKKVKIEGLRKQIVDGADFAEIAKANSDCPSKEQGGDLGEIKRGQTVKPFEEAAFSQEKNAVGPVVTTEYGYHIIQVLGKNPGKTVSLAEVKGKIATHLEQQKLGEAFDKLVTRLRKNATIIYYENS